MYLTEPTPAPTIDCSNLVLGGLVTTGESVRDAMMGSYVRSQTEHDGKEVYIHTQPYVDIITSYHNTTLPNKRNRVFLFYTKVFRMWVVGPTLTKSHSQNNPIVWMAFHGESLFTPAAAQWIVFDHNVSGSLLWCFMYLFQQHSHTPVFHAS
jgi:hypothetical protein